MADGDQKLREMALHIARTLGRTETMTEDILQTYSTFDDRFSRSNLYRTDEDGAASSSASGNMSLANVERTLRYLDRQISRVVALQRPIWSDSQEATSFLDSFDTLLDTMSGLDPMVPTDRRLLDHASEVLHKAAQRLEAEFKILVEQGSSGGNNPLDPFAEGGPISPPFDSDDEDDVDGFPGTTSSAAAIPVAQPVTDYNVVIDALPWGTISDLHEIAKRMVAAGFARDCAAAFAGARREFLEESVARLGVRPWTSAEVHGTAWGDLEEEIRRWPPAAKVAFRILFPSERRLADRVFAGLGPVADAAYAESCAAPALRLLGFAGAVASGAKAPERLFRIIDLYEALRELAPVEFDACFADPYTAPVRNEAWDVCERLGKAIRGIFTELENLVTRDPPGTSPIAGGGVHPMTRYVMNYLRTASASWRTLEEVMDDDPESLGGGGGAAGQMELRRASSFSVQISWIMKILLGNLDTKALLYRDSSMKSIFLMNNTRYIIQKVKDSELRQLLGDDWIRLHAGRVRLLQGTYHKNTWAKAAMQLQASTGGGGVYNSDVVREKINTFCTQLEDICRVQTSWSVPDEELREDIKMAAVEAVVPGYRALIGRVRGSGREAIRQMERYVKYSVDDVQAMIEGLFQGPPRNHHH